MQSNFFIELICFGLISKERTSSSATNSTRQVSVADGTKFFLFIFLRLEDSMISSMTRKKYLNFFHSVSSLSGPWNLLLFYSRMHVAFYCLQLFFVGNESPLLILMVGCTKTKNFRNTNILGECIDLYFFLLAICTSKRM